MKALCKYAKEETVGAGYTHICNLRSTVTYIRIKLEACERCNAYEPRYVEEIVEYPVSRRIRLAKDRL
jgi:hypothetical protein